MSTASPAHLPPLGARSRALHVQLDELIASWRDLAVTVAERALTIGSWPDGSGLRFSFGER
jgi:DNA-binding ferritin-like protein